MALMNRALKTHSAAHLRFFHLGKTPSPRGQAVVELALGAVVFVAVLIGGIYFAEVGHLALKVQEAQMSALWDASGRRTMNRHDGTGPSDTSAFSGIPLASAMQAQGAYLDFNGLGGGQHTERKQVFTRGYGLEVHCENEPSLGFPSAAVTRGVHPNVGSLHCQSEANVALSNVPNDFLVRTNTEAGFFKNEILSSRPIKLCGVGRATAGVCEGAVSLMTNDWGLWGDETQDCPLGGCNTSVYKNTVRQLFAPGGAPAKAFANKFAGEVSADPAQYFFSYRDRAHGHVESLLGEGGFGGDFNTGGPGVGMHAGMSETNSKCFAGGPGPCPN
jgi:hypothetical protein